MVRASFTNRDTVAKINTPDMETWTTPVFGVIFKKKRLSLRKHCKPANMTKIRIPSPERKKSTKSDLTNLATTPPPKTPQTSPEIDY